MSVLIVSRSPEGGLWRWDGSGATAEMVVQAPDTAFALTLPDGRVLTLGGAEEGRLRLLARTAAGYAVTAEVATQGGEPCHAAVLPGGRHVVVVNYHLEGSVLVLALDPEPRVVQRLVLGDPGAGVVVDRQEAAHPHFALVVDESTVLVSDLGCDRIRRFAWRDERLEEVGSCATPAGSGPRHLARHGGAVVVSAELSDEVLAAPLADVLAGDAGWQVAQASSRSLASARDGGERLTHPGEIVVASDGRVHVANRGAGTIGQLVVDGETARLTWLGEIDAAGVWPQHLLLMNDDLLIAAHDADLVVGPRGQVRVPTPVWLARGA